jgi:hypothetical protein
VRSARASAPDLRKCSLACVTVTTPVGEQDAGYQQFLLKFLPTALDEIARITRKQARDWHLPEIDAERLESSFSVTLLGTGPGKDKLLRSLYSRFGANPDPVEIRRWAAAYFGADSAGRRMGRMAAERRASVSIDEMYLDDDSPRPKVEIADESATIAVAAAAQADERKREQATVHRDFFVHLDRMEKERAAKRLDDLCRKLEQTRAADARALRDRAAGRTFAEAAERVLKRTATRQDVNTFNVRFLRAWKALSPAQAKSIAPVCSPPERNPRKGRRAKAG